MEPAELQKYREILSSTYKSLEHPDFAFVKKVFSARPYDPLIKRLRDYAVIEEMTEAEDDVCFSYLLKGQSALWRLDLSVVAPLGIFIRVKSRISSDDFLYATKADATAFETKVMNLLKGAGIKLMRTDELSAEIPMNLYNTNKSKVCLYQALFADRELLPWEA